MLTDLSFLRPGQQWPPPTEKDRLQQYADNKKLFDRNHNDVFKDWNRLLREDMKTALLIVLNWHKRLSLLWADLLLGEPPRIRVVDNGDEAPEDDSPEQEALNRIIRDNRLMLTAYSVAIDISRYGTGIFKVRGKDGKAVIEGQPPNVWFPVVAPDNVKETQYHVLAWTFTMQGPPGMMGLTGPSQKMYLKVEIHEKGRINHHLFLLKELPGEKCCKIDRELPLNSLDAYKDLTPVQETGVDDFLVLPVSGVVTTDQPEGIGPDDYRDIECLIMELMTRFSQIAKILDKHSDPNMSGPDSATSEEPWYGRPEMVAGGKYFPVGPGDVEPKYITWDGQLEAAYSEIKELMAQLYILSETSPAAFGQLEQGLAESGSALRRLMMAPLAKVNRIRMNFDPTLKQLLHTVAELEVAQSFQDAQPIEEVEIEWRDGLPEDLTEQVNIENIARTAEITSRQSSMRRMWGLTGKALKRELELVDSEKKAAMELIAPPGEKTNPKFPGQQENKPPKENGGDN